MLYRTKQFYGKHLETRDGDRVGHISDCYFDERNWTVLFFGVDTDWWTPFRRVLVSPRVFLSIPRHGRVLPVNLTRRQIENGPALDPNEPVTARHGADFYRYYNWPFYWLGGSLWGPSDFPGEGPGAGPQLPPNRKDTRIVPAEEHLRSTRALFGFPIQCPSARIGKVEDLMVDDKQWRVHYLVMELDHHWFVPETMIISTQKVLPIDWQRERVSITPSKNEISRALSRRRPETIHEAQAA